jgi:hypothetical protein
MTINMGPDFLETAFELGDDNIPVKYTMLHTAIMQKMLEEAKNVPMTTANYILIERIATNYIIIKMREAAGFENLNPIAQDKQNVYLLSVLAQFQKMLAKATAQEDREATLREVRDIIKRVLSSSDSPAKAELLNDLVEEFRKVGI